MITPLLEKLIATGHAKSATFVLGASGVGTIPVPKDEFIIIHHFDYWHFLDEPLSTAAVRPSSSFSFTFAGAVSVSYQVLGVRPVPGFTVFDNLDVPATTIAFQATLDAEFGVGSYIVSSLSFNPISKLWESTVLGIPGTSLNGVSPVVASNVPAAVVVTPFVGGVDAFITEADVMKHSEHILEFRTMKSRNHFAIRENVSIIRSLGVDPETGDSINTVSFNTTGVYSKDCYLAHTENVQVDIWRVPQPSEWAIPFGLQGLPLKSQEFKVPVGYGIPPSPFAPAVRNVFFDGALLLDQYLPLTTDRDDSVNVDAKDQFRPNMGPGRELQNPQNINLLMSNKRQYPLVNVDYVSMNKNYMNGFMDSL